MSNAFAPRASRADTPAVALPLLPAPTTVQEAGLSLDLLTQIVLKTLYFSGELSGAELAKRLGVIFAVVEPSLEFLKVQRHVEVIGGAILGGSSYRYRITSEGRSAAGLFLQQNQYVGPAPVPLEQYRSYLRAFSAGVAGRLTREDVRQAYATLVLGDSVVDGIGPAVNGGHSIFIYGPPGNGKTMIARGIRQLLRGTVAVPHAIEVEGNIIRVFDPVNHEEVPAGPETGIAVSLNMDGRWAMCRRPLVSTGGELTLEAFELSYDARVGYYRAPVQLVANGGLLVIDDFGRQRCAPGEFLNRWMVPLENRVDYLTLQSGLKFEVPFLVFLAIATNINPSQLVDEALLRRVQYKVFAENPSRPQYTQIFEQTCRDRGVAADGAVVDYLLDTFYPNQAVTPRACHPRDLINQALLLAEYRGEPRRLTIELLETACAGYFVTDRRNEP